MSGIWLFLNNMLYYTWGFIVARYSKGKEIKELIKELKDYKSRIDKATEIYKNRNTCKYKKERFMKDKSTSDLMYEVLQGDDKE